MNDILQGVTIGVVVGIVLGILEVAKAKRSRRAQIRFIRQYLEKQFAMMGNVDDLAARGKSPCVAVV